MSKIRINDLARELEVKSKEILDVLTTVGVTEKKTHSSSLEDHEAELVRKHLRGRSEAAPSSAKTSRAAHGDEGIKTKIDLSNISRPGDVLRAITQQKGAAEHPAARPAVKPPVAKPAVEAKAEAPAAPVAPKAVPLKPASEAPAPPTPRMVTPASVAAGYRPPTVVVIPPKVPVAPPAATTPAATTSAAPPAIAVPPRVTSSTRANWQRSASGAASGECYADASGGAREVSGSDCPTAANDHAADRPAPGIQGASGCAGSARAEVQLRVRHRDDLCRGSQFFSARHGRKRRDRRGRRFVRVNGGRCIRREWRRRDRVRWV